MITHRSSRNLEFANNWPFTNRLKVNIVIFMNLVGSFVHIVITSSQKILANFLFDKTILRSFNSTLFKIMTLGSGVFGNWKKKYSE